MATAPRPGAAQAQEAARHVLRLRVKDQTYDCPLPSNLPIREKFAVRAATGSAIEAHFKDQTAFGEDSLIILWWLARRAAGEPQLSFDKALNEWPDDLTEDDLDFSHVDLADDDQLEIDHPEA